MILAFVEVVHVGLNALPLKLLSTELGEWWTKLLVELSTELLGEILECDEFELIDVSSKT